jgi:hypothetical protein
MRTGHEPTKVTVVDLIHFSVFDFAGAQRGLCDRQHNFRAFVSTPLGSQGLFHRLCGLSPGNVPSPVAAQTGALNNRKNFSGDYQLKD